MAIPFNNRALRFVRLQRDFSIETLAQTSRISVDRLTQIEEGIRTPTVRQAEVLADLLLVPIYQLYGEGVPNLPEQLLDYRKRTPEIAVVSSAGLKVISTTEKVSEFTLQIANALEFSFRKLRQPNSANYDPAVRAGALRRDFDAWLAPRKRELAFVGSPASMFLSAVRIYFETFGFVTVVNSAPATDYLGFFTSKEGLLPSIFVNRAVLSKKSQLFTFMHEVSHALNNTSGISNPFSALNTQERECNKFAVEFLAPISSLEKLVREVNGRANLAPDVLIPAISTRSLLSKQATAIRLQEGGFITRQQCARWFETAINSLESEKAEEKLLTDSAFGVPHAKRVAEIGTLAVGIAAEGVGAGIIDAIDVANGLGISVKLQDRAFSLATRRFRVAAR